MIAPSAEERADFRRAVRELLAADAGSAALRRTIERDAGHDAALWGRLAGELGVHALWLPEPHGAGLPFADLAAAFGELGRRLAAPAVLPSVVLAGAAIVTGADAAQRDELLPAIAEGAAVATLALHDDPASPLRAARADGGVRLDGTRTAVASAAHADLLVAPVTTRAGATLVAVPLPDPRVAIEPLAALDLTRPLARVVFRGARAEVLGEDGAAGPAIARALDLGAVALAAEQVGSALELVDLAVAHAKARVQFGRPIGSFQAIKHQLARAHVDAQSAAAAVARAARLADERPGELPAAAALAAAHAADVHVAVARRAIQVHGGMGFTWEHDAHLHYRRAVSSAQLLRRPEQHREALLRALL